MRLYNFKNWAGARAKTPNVSDEEFELCESYFDIEHYREAVGKPHLDANTGLLHYLGDGWREDYDPSEDFSTKGYLKLYPDVAAADINPLLHYVRHGRFENRHIQHVHGTFFGRIEQVSGRGIKGWVVSQQSPGMVIPLKVLIDGTLYATIHNEIPRADLMRSNIGEGLGGFQLSIPLDRLEPGRYEIIIELPNGEQLIETTVIDDSAPSLHDTNPRSLVESELHTLKVIVPIYNAFDDVVTCIERLHMHTPDKIEILLINDCSSDPAIGDLLESVSATPQFRIIHNEENLGFTKTVNRGIIEAGEADVIILNSDARVTPRWIEGMTAAARSRKKVATVTAMSDRAGAFSAPNIGNDNRLPTGVSEEQFARAFRRRSLRLRPEVATGNGFCMLIKRDALIAMGGLDEEAFPRGYGEENDFCMRALRQGWTNLIDDSTYVFHDRSKSFGEEKNENITRGRKIIDERYPEYKLLVRQFHTSSAIMMARFRARLALEDCVGGRGVLPRALFVLSTRTGGTPQTNADLMGALNDTFECFVLNCDSRTMELSVVNDGHVQTIRTHTLSEPIEPLTHISSDYDNVANDWLSTLDLDIIHIRHLGWHSLGLPKVAASTGARVVMSFHDFYCLSPSLKLLDDDNVFRGGVYREGNQWRTVELWESKSMPVLTENWLQYWRERMARALANCDGFVTTSESAYKLIASTLPSLPKEHFHVIPHGRDFSHFANLQHLPDGIGPIRILVPGNINTAKGLSLIATLIELDKVGQFEFHFLGLVHQSVVDKKILKRMVLHGSYNRKDFAQKVRSIRPSFGLVFSIWDETYCHTLTEMWSVGIPAVVLDFPNVRNRMEKSGAGWILSDMKAEVVYRELERISYDRSDLMQKGAAAVEWQFQRGRAQTCRQMASRYLDVYCGRTVEQGKPKVAVTSPASRDLNSSFASTQIRVWEKTRNSLDRPQTYIRSGAASLIAKMKLGMIDGAIVQRTAIPVNLIEDFITTASETKTPYIFELDDQLMKVPADKDLSGFYVAYAPSLEKLLRHAAAVVVSTPSLKVEISNLNNNIHCVENRISARLWAGGRKQTSSYGGNILYVGTRTHDEDLAFILKAMEIARERNPNLLLSVIGVTDRDDLPDWVTIIDVPEEFRSYNRFVPWLRKNTESAILGVAPLIDSEFNRFKSDLKVLDYGALGLPVIASDVESFRSFATQQVSGVTLLRNEPKIWARVIIEKISSSKTLKAEGQDLQAWVFKNRRVEDDFERFDRIVAETLKIRIS